MSRLTISMPDQMNEWVESQIAAGRYGNVSEYFRDLVRRDQERAEASGVSDHAFPDILEAARREARQKGLLRDEN